MSTLRDAVRIVKEAAKANETLEMTSNGEAWTIIDALNNGEGVINNTVYYSNYMVTADYHWNGKHYRLATNDPDTLYVALAENEPMLCLLREEGDSPKDRRIEMEL